MTKKINLTEEQKEEVKNNKSFCPLPWIHIHTTPNNLVMPCCITKMEDARFIKSDNSSSIKDYIDSEYMRSLRLKMLAGEKSFGCGTCYRQEENMESFRQSTIKEYNHYIDEILDNTNKDGSIDNFKMRYLDIRLNNICNFKCRTCNSAYSSSWEKEDRKYNDDTGKPDQVINRATIMDNIIDNLQDVDKAYFAGGEPLVTEEHYIILEELIRKGRTNTRLVYNTNISNLKFKDKDLLGLWDKFDNRIELYASLDHYGKKAEYIRHGTDWNNILENYRKLFINPKVRLNITTSISIFNYLSITDFFDYMLHLKLFPSNHRNRGVWFLNPVYSPDEVSMTNLPKHIKEEANIKIQKYSNDVFKLCPELDYNLAEVKEFSNRLKDMVNVANQKDTWKDFNETAKNRIEEIDKRRAEDFYETFPELAGIFDE